ncbi:MAG: NmrA family NAD(P)-binding protein [Alphaproteobacteria bacterium]
MQIAVVGASGNTGSVVAELALKDGHDLRAIVRNPDSCVNLAHSGAEIVTGDLKQFVLLSAIGPETAPGVALI